LEGTLPTFVPTSGDRVLVVLNLPVLGETVDVHEEATLIGEIADLAATGGVAKIRVRSQPHTMTLDIPRRLLQWSSANEAWLIAENGNIG
jgi:hypothetical protein